jgi:hypothetical protein
MTDVQEALFRRENLACPLFVMGEVRLNNHFRACARAKNASGRKTPIDHLVTDMTSNAIPPRAAGVLSRPSRNGCRADDLSLPFSPDMHLLSKVHTLQARGASRESARWCGC